MAALAGDLARDPRPFRELSALAALKPFCEAARQETVTVELTRRVGEHLHRAQRGAGLREH